jgi:hypothetical protein
MASRKPTTEHSRRFSVDSEVCGAKPSDFVYELSDSTARGLRMRIQPSGAKTWWYVYKDGTRTTQRVRIGEPCASNARTTDQSMTLRRPTMRGVKRFYPWALDLCQTFATDISAQTEVVGLDDIPPQNDRPE